MNILFHSFLLMMGMDFSVFLFVNWNFHSDSFHLEQAKWYLRAAEGGYVRAMYNASLCYSFGEGFVQSHRQAKKWMKRAADRGHSKAQLEHGLCLFSVCDRHI